MNENAIMNKAADNIRILSASMVEQANPDIRAVPWVGQIISMSFF